MGIIEDLQKQRDRILRRDAIRARIDEMSGQIVSAGKVIEAAFAAGNVTEKTRALSVRVLKINGTMSAAESEYDDMNRDVVRHKLPHSLKDVDAYIRKETERIQMKQAAETGMNPAAMEAPMSSESDLEDPACKKKRPRTRKHKETAKTDGKRAETKGKHKETAKPDGKRPKPSAPRKALRKKGEPEETDDGSDSSEICMDPPPSEHEEEDEGCGEQLKLDRQTEREQRKEIASNDKESGKKVNVPGDKPLAAGSLMRLHYSWTATSDGPYKESYAKGVPAIVVGVEDDPQHTDGKRYWVVIQEEAKPKWCYLSDHNAKEGYSIQLSPSMFKRSSSKKSQAAFERANALYHSAFKVFMDEEKIRPGQGPKLEMVRNTLSNYLEEFFGKASAAAFEGLVGESGITTMAGTVPAEKERSPTPEDFTHPKDPLYRTRCSFKDDESINSSNYYASAEPSARNSERMSGQSMVELAKESNQPNDGMYFCSNTSPQYSDAGIEHPETPPTPPVEPSGQNCPVSRLQGSSQSTPELRPQGSSQSTPELSPRAIGQITVDLQGFSQSTPELSPRAIGQITTELQVSSQGSPASGNSTPEILPGAGAIIPPPLSLN